MAVSHNWAFRNADAPNRMSAGTSIDDVTCAAPHMAPATMMAATGGGILSSKEFIRPVRGVGLSVASLVLVSTTTSSFAAKPPPAHREWCRRAPAATLHLAPSSASSLPCCRACFWSCEILEMEIGRSLPLGRVLSVRWHSMQAIRQLGPVNACEGLRNVPHERLV